MGLHLGYGRGADFSETAWSTRTASLLDQFVSSGLRQFYMPPSVDQSGVSYDWSFLHPVASLTLSSGERSVALPDDFGGIEGPITLSSSASQVWEIGQYNEAMVRTKFAAFPDSTGPPEMVAISPQRGTSLTKGQQNNLAVFPEADQDYTFEFQYYITPDALTGSRPYAYGGAVHAETILASCKAAAELDLDDLVNGPQRMKFMERLAVSISLDRRMKPQKFGYNADRSDEKWNGRRKRWGLNNTTITFNGATAED